MSTGRKPLLAAQTAWPVVYMLLFFAWIAVTFATNDDGDPAGPAFGVVFGFHMATILLTLGLTVFYVLHALRSGRVPEDQRLLWVRRQHDRDADLLVALCLEGRPERGAER